MSRVCAARRRSRSFSIARSTGASRGWAARCRRCRADCRVASKGSALPVSWACCWAMRRPASMSTSRFSSRERERLWISSSSCPRCRATSPKRPSIRLSRAALSLTVSWACLAQALASSDCCPASWLWRASCSCMRMSFCQSSAERAKASTAMAPAAQVSQAREDPVDGSVGVACVACVGAAVDGGGRFMAGILSRPPGRRAWQAPVRPAPSPARASARQCGDGWPGRGPADRSRPAAAGPGGRPPRNC